MSVTPIITPPPKKPQRTSAPAKKDKPSKPKIGAED